MSHASEAAGVIVGAIAAELDAVLARARSRANAAIAARLAAELGPLSREDMAFIATRRGEVTPAAVWAPSSDLSLLAARPTADELAALAARRIKRGVYDGWTLTQLADRARKLELAPSGRTRGGIVDAILDAGDPLLDEEVPLDEDQQALVDKWEAPAMYVSAGPGAGKTTTMCRLAAHIARHAPRARVLILAFNVQAADIFRSRLTRLGVRIVDKRKIANGPPGVYCETFDKYVYWSRAGAESAAEAASVLGGLYDDDAPAAPPAAPPPAKAWRAKPPHAGRGARATWPARAEGEEEDGGGPGQSHRHMFESSLLKPMAASERWDWIIVDEGQDVQVHHELAIEQLRPRAKHIFASGDPRQELYTGARWFSNAWAEGKVAHHVLRYNHRSSRAVVQFLNAYSRRHFPNLHHDQIATRDVEGEVTYELVAEEAKERKERRGDSSNNSAGNAIAGFLHSHKPGAAYAIAPVTVRKYNTEPIITTARQMLYEEGSFTRLCVLDGPDKIVIDNTSHFIGSSYRLKGTERDHVIAFHTELPYDRYGVERSSLLKLLFVAFSRARDTLKIIIYGPLDPDSSPIYGLPFTVTPPAKHPKEESKPSHGRPLGPPALSVTDLVQYECWGEPRVEAANNYDAVEVSVANDADFVGVYVEKHLALTLGVELKMPKLRIARLCRRDAECYMRDCEGSECKNYERTGIKNYFSAEGDLIDELVVHPWRYGEFKIEYDRLITVFSSNPAYAVAAAGYSARANRPWTVSERLISHRFTTELAGPAAAAQLWASDQPQEGAKWVSGLSSQTLAAPDRRYDNPTGMNCWCCGEFDLSRGASVVEVKHAIPSPKHAIQAELYAIIAGAPEALLLNTKVGAAEVVRVRPETRANFPRVVRAATMLRLAAARGNACHHRINYAPRTTVHISLDLETAPGGITEIGALAFEAGTDRILGVFARLAPGVSASADPSANFDTGLEVTDRAAFRAGQDAFAAAFRTWAEGMSPQCTFLHWGGGEVSWLRKTGLRLERPAADGGPPEPLVIDVYERFRVWLARSGSARDGDKKLEDAVAQLLMPGTMHVPHRAFEDAAAAAAVFNTICYTGGAV